MEIGICFQVPADESTAFNIKVKEIGESGGLDLAGSAIRVNDFYGLARASEKGGLAIDDFYDRIGTGYIRFAEISRDDSGLSFVKNIKNIVFAFGELHKYFRIEIDSGSSGLNLCYFNRDEMRILTDNGRSLSPTPLEVREKILRFMADSLAD